ncbi:MAG TPA: sulfatase [Catenuloplanes sp.]
MFTHLRRLPTQRRPTGQDDPTTGDRRGRPPADDTTGHPTGGRHGTVGAGDPGAGTGADVRDVAVVEAGGRSTKHPVRARVADTLAFLLVVIALLAPNDISRLTPMAFVGIPVEVVVGAALLLLLPAMTRRVVAAAAGVTLGLLAIVKILDMGFLATFSRQFDPVLDWILLDDGVSFLTDSVGRAGAVGAVIAVAVLIAALLVLVTLSVLRLSALVVRHRGTAPAALTVVGAGWVTCALLGAQIVPGVPIASSGAASLAYQRALLVPAGLRDQQAFAAESAVDAFRDTAPADLLTGLRGKDVVLAFVESYGRDAVQNPEFAGQVGAVLEAGNRRLGAAGYASRSGFLTAPTAGGRSWLAHATLLSGLWIDNQQRYRNLVSTDRLTLTGAFQRASWRTVGVLPGATTAWPEGAFYRYDRIYDAQNLGYRGPQFSWSTMPDQYTLSAFERSEHARADRGPLMAQIPLTSSHAPWAPIPELVDWRDVGDGSIFNAMPGQGEAPDAVWRDPTRVRTEYRRSIEYSLNSLISYVEKYGDDDLVVIFLGDHQPATIVTGPGASWDVPVTVVTRDRAVLDRISGWGWQDGLKPGPQAPVWRMDTFRDRFLTAFGPRLEPGRPPSPPAR